MNIDRFALWDEDSHPITSADLYFSDDGTAYTHLQLIVPHTNTGGADYPVEVFNFGAGPKQFQYFAMVVGGCSNYCGIGEVAFSSVDAAVPIPAALPLFASGLGVMGLLGWRRKRKKAAAMAAS